MEKSTNAAAANCDDSNSKQNNFTIMVKATAITSLTVPKISSGKLRAVVPFSFWVQRLGEYLDIDIQGFGGLFT
eukprot:scaffold43275_cov67-Cyclotella_meneghiniana.AAC.6